MYWMVGWLPGGSAGTSFCSGTEMSISFRAMASPSGGCLLLAVCGRVEASPLEFRPEAPRRESPGRGRKSISRLWTRGAIERALGDQVRECKRRTRRGVLPTPSQTEHRDCTDRRSRALAHLHRQADEGELTLAKQGFQIAQALDVSDVEVEAGLVDHQVHVAHRPRPHRIDAEMHDALLRKPFGRHDIHAGIIDCIFLARKGSLVMTGAEQDGAALW